MHPELDSSPHTRPESYLTAAIPGTGGAIKQRPEDFIVEEIPAYDPSGEGEHIYLFVQKVGLSTSQLVSILARHFGVREYAVGYAGLKDRHAITRQVVSIHTPGKTPEDFPMLRDGRIQVLWSDLHGNKLRRGHLRANRFSIKVRNVPLRSVFDARRTLDALATVGVPNRAGEQRFGILANNHLVGRAILLGDDQLALDILLGPLPEGVPPLSHDNQRSRRLYAEKKYTDAAVTAGKGAITERRALAMLAKGATPRQAIDALNGLARSFFLTSFQSAVFNRVLDDRLRAGAFDRLLPGDVAFKHANGALFPVTEEELAKPDTAARLAAIEISPSGPLWGPDMFHASGATAEAERDALASFGVTPEHLAAAAPRFGQEHQGHRRPLRVPLSYPSVHAGGDEHGHYIQCDFELPPGAFATVVMDEVMKTAPVTPLPGGEGPGVGLTTAAAPSAAEASSDFDDEDG
ncbi:MAG TPA: tRNA pseudouridine(13) synthase TruD [Phycisphaerales bacterium]|nr:tRNA pseudouridine(13) synthase TruD [Phycisphaerales bacterium]